MAVRRVRVDLIRFGLLLTMTVALISVATRHDDHTSGRDTAARGRHPASAAPSPSSGQAEAPSQGGSSPARSGGSTAPRSGSSPPQGTTGSGTPKENGGGGSEVAVPTLPRTGGTQAVELAALASLFIAAGSFGMRISRPRAATVQAEAPPITVTQAAQPLGSAESNRPGTV